MKVFLNLFIAAFLAVSGNLSLKKGMMAVGKITLGRESFLAEIFKIFTQPFIIVGLGFYFVSMLFWLKILSSQYLSFAYPLMIALTFIFLSLGSFFFLKEEITLAKVLGMGVIILGMALVAKG